MNPIGSKIQKISIHPKFSTPQFKNIPHKSFLRLHWVNSFLFPHQLQCMCEWTWVRTSDSWYVIRYIKFAHIPKSWHSTFGVVILWIVKRDIYRSNYRNYVPGLIRKFISSICNLMLSVIMIWFTNSFPIFFYWEIWCRFRIVCQHCYRVAW